MMTQELAHLGIENKTDVVGIDLDRVRSLERQMAQVDAEIDQHVYRIYSLTEEEIKIVEGG